MTGLPVMQAVNRAEATGDARKALDLIEADLAQRADESFWHPDRLTSLYQVAVLGPVLPAWVRSRWILAQAMRWMDDSQRHRWSRAFELTVEVAGGPERYDGIDEHDSMCKLMDYDWVYRQLVLYDCGGLPHFLDRVASRRLIDDADDVRAWASAPMGAFRLLERTSSEVRWLDLGPKQEVRTADIGSSSLLQVGEHAIGRLVPTQQGLMFESAPIFVPPDVARWVGDTPSDWTSALRRGCHRAAPIGRHISTRTTGFAIVTDVPVAHQRALVERVAGGGDASRWSGQQVRDGMLKVIHAALTGELPTHDTASEPWPVVSALLLEPEVVSGLALSSARGDAADLRRLAPRLVSPAQEVCLALAGERGTAA